MNKLNHNDVLQLVGNLFQATSVAGQTRLQIIYQDMHLVCNDAGPQLQKAWQAIEPHFNNDDVARDALLQVLNLLRARGSDVSLKVGRDGVAVPVEESLVSVPVWLAPHAMHGLHRFAERTGKSMSDAAALLISVGLQIRDHIGDPGL